MREVGFNDTISKPVVLAMGFFDCVHKGHRAIFDGAADAAKRIGASAAVITFVNNPSDVLKSGSGLIYTYSERLEIFKSLGIEYCIPFVFDSSFCTTSREVFWEMLLKRVNIKGIICGHDYRFGSGGTGTVDYLRQECAARNIHFDALSPVTQDGERVSTTAIKSHLQNGEIELANSMLCAPYFIESEVVRGRGDGKRYEFPTLNFTLEAGKVLPMFGVYETTTVFGGARKRSLTNIGGKPTFGDAAAGVETFVLDENRELYGKKVRIEFNRFIRKIIKFNSPDELAAQIKEDLNKAYPRS